MHSAADSGASTDRNGHGRFAEPFENRAGRVWVTDPDTGEVLGQIDLDGMSASTAGRALQAPIDATFFALVADMAGAPRELLDTDTGDVAARVSQSLYGRRTWRGETSSPLLFAGQYEDPESGWVYNRFRFYDPVAGMYGAQDPLGVGPKIASSQGYVNHAVGMVDPLGLMAHKHLDENGSLVDYNGPIRDASVNGVHPRTGVEYIDGYPKFDDYVYRDIIEEKTVLADFQITPTGSRAQDKIVADGIFKQKFGYDRPRDGNWAWHHHQDYGRMQLVDINAHGRSGHTGGYAIWNVK